LLTRECTAKLGWMVLPHPSLQPWFCSIGLPSVWSNERWTSREAVPQYWCYHRGC
jgi:hypothetical protein